MAMLGLDLFCGCGGTTYGLRTAGIDVVRGVDFDGRYAPTYQRNNPGAEYLVADIKTTNPGELVPDSLTARSESMVLSASPPCQPFSTLNRYRCADDPNRGMSEAILGVVRLARPEYAVIENVPAYRNSHDWSMLRGGLEVAGYRVSFRVENLAEYGVPQHRVRFVAVATLDSSCFPPMDPARRTMTVRDAIGGMEDDPDYYHYHTPEHLALMAALPKDGGSIFDLPERVRPPCRRTGHRRHTHSRMHWDSPSPTITTRNSFGSVRTVHPEFNRVLTVAEKARIQTFPDGYFRVDEHSSRPLCYKMMGNAVPPLYAFRLGMALLKHHQETKREVCVDAVVRPRRSSQRR